VSSSLKILFVFCNGKYILYKVTKPSKLSLKKNNFLIYVLSHWPTYVLAGSFLAYYALFVILRRYMLKCSKYFRISDRDSSLNWYFSPFYLLTRDCLHFVLYGPKLCRDMFKLCSWLYSHNAPIFFWCLLLVRGFFYSALSPYALFSKNSTDSPHAPLFPSVLRIHDILGWIRIRGSMPQLRLMDSDPGSGSCYFRHWPSRCQQKTNFLTQFFLLITFWSYIYIIFHRWKVTKSHKIVGIKICPTIFAWW
jgi:hypothetical protein